MSKLRHVTTASLRWSWFVLLVLVAFGYLVAGLSGNQNSKLTSYIDASMNGSPGVATVSMFAVNRIQESLRPAVEEINVARQQRLANLGLDHAEQADWLTVCRRLSLALVGNGLSLE